MIHARDAANPPAPAPLKAMLELSGLGFAYAGGRQAVAGLTLQLGAGIVGLLGPNGAGKSTLMRMLATLTRPTEGRILWRGRDIARDPEVLRHELGYLPQEFGIYPAQTAREFLCYLAAVKGLPHAAIAARVEECMEMVGLAAGRDRPIGSFSGGMRQRVGIAQALLNDPALLIVDEPTVGLDPGERQRFRNMLTELAGSRLVILSTHIVSDVEAIATSLVVMQKGRLRFAGSPEALLHNAAGKVWDWTVPEHALEGARSSHRVCNALRRPDGVQLRVVSEQSPHRDAIPVLPGLEEAYMVALVQEA
ncbi:ABC transporter ATP-binding protein [Pseudoduganella violaceinigra]|uniref:ABC transporter ATP-binding protein n=1 Tax=Pseudoduganella violaceinigra TaxID=246602 RepID=UPI00041E3D0D|nr:ABC transporter ATP-binding protein [Pseudoduganella violaceinigra]